ncbi:HAD family hydrolase [Oceanobacillus picturae]|uniref:HAD family hydrolase n=1 Tax=Oceanobacillus picturae TaxID=171693 RepID=A0A0U9HEL2_9BACI|nr:hypothetical protein [Oceanobacillus picturae]GAQ18516.1 HAD family hydrolase [Oceanobacillus picturae]
MNKSNLLEQYSRLQTDARSQLPEGDEKETLHAELHRNESETIRAYLEPHRLPKWAETVLVDYDYDTEEVEHIREALRETVAECTRIMNEHDRITTELQSGVYSEKLESAYGDILDEVITKYSEINNLPDMVARHLFISDFSQTEWNMILACLREYVTK